MRRPYSFKLGFCGLGFLTLAGCDQFNPTRLGERLPPYSTPVGKPANAIEKALAGCPEKTEAEETKCVRRILTDGTLDETRLATVIPGCRWGKVCHYTYTTDDRLGYLASTASDFVVRWQVSIDLRHVSKLSDASVLVTQR